jgi:hypothetical protein
MGKIGLTAKADEEGGQGAHARGVGERVHRLTALRASLDCRVFPGDRTAVPNDIEHRTLTHHDQDR